MRATPKCYDNGNSTVSKYGISAERRDCFATRSGPTMANPVLQPWHLLLTIMAGIVNREQQRAIDYLRTENQVLREKIGKKRIILDDDQRKRLAVKGKVLGRKALENIATIVTPDTIMRWHRMPVAAKWDYT